ncbi:SEC-C metal-binding domain-containing protein [Nonomuraea sp. M3C6]|uniref:SEC-C metal-binding domain-containing protein n=1 Tax=Nonomuraea marmarensis TaxID=3351344 RepID=A0ABW7AJE9_9ACTN
MIPDEFFHPLDLHDLIDEAFGADEDVEAARDVLLEALLDPRAQGDSSVFSYAWDGVELYEEPAEAVEMLTAVIDAHPRERFGLGALRASLREGDEAVKELTSLHASLSLLPPAERDPHFYLIAPSALADGGAEEQGIALAREGIELMTELGLPDEATEIMDRSPDPEHARAAAERLRNILEEVTRSRLGSTPRGKRAMPPDKHRFRVAYLPLAEFTRGLAENLLDGTYPDAHEDYRRELQAALADTSEMGQVSVVPLTIDALLEFAGTTGADPARRSTRVALVEEVDEAGDVRWPPERNQPCWCGTGAKYKKCCGRPGFGQASVPDRGRLTLRVELDHCEPPVWRQVAVPSRIRLDSLHEVLVDAMGWDGDHMYAFEIDGAQILDPRAGEEPRADETVLPMLANEPGQSLVYRYDFGDDWTHTVTVEEVAVVDPSSNTPRVLAGQGACPPEDCGGVHAYRHLLEALAGQDSPDHADAAELLGKDWDATEWRR